MTAASVRTRLALLTTNDQLWASLAAEHEVARPNRSEAGVRALLDVDVVLLDAAGRDLRPLVRALAGHHAPPILVRDPRASAGEIRGYLDAGADAVSGGSEEALEARIANLARFQPGMPASQDDAALTVGTLTVSLTRREVSRAGAPVHLTPTEFSLLEVLLERPNTTVDAARLIARVWGVDASSAAHYLRTYVHRLRRVVEEQPERPQVLLTDRGGYRCLAQRPARAAAHGDGDADVAWLIDLAAAFGGALRTQLLYAGLQPASVDRAEDIPATATPAATGAAALVFVTPSTVERIRFIRRRTAPAPIPVVALLDDGSEESIARALRAGADEAIPAAAPAGEIAARTRALVGLVRRQQRRSPRLVHTGALTIDRGSGRVRVDSDDVALSRTEYRLLDVLAAHAGQVVGHDDLLGRVWGEACRGATHYLRVYIASLRSKLGDDGRSPRYLLNEWGVGYRLALLPAEPAG